MIIQTLRSTFNGLNYDPPMKQGNGSKEGNRYDGQKSSMTACTERVTPSAAALSTGPRITAIPVIPLGNHTLTCTP